MPQVTVFDMTGKSVGEMTLSDAIFGIEPNTSVMHAAVVNYLANQRQGTQSTLTRSEVSGGGRKPWKQKGTGRARQGSTRAPQWTHGGIALGPKPRDYSYTLPKKVKRLALKSAFSTFQQEHPKFMPFIHAVKGDACRKDSIIEISVKSPEGRNYTTNFRVTEKDLELIQMLKDMQENQ